MSVSATALSWRKASIILVSTLTGASDRQSGTDHCSRISYLCGFRLLSSVDSWTFQMSTGFLDNGKRKSAIRESLADDFKGIMSSRAHIIA